MKRLYIYAGTADQAQALARDMDLQPTEWTYVLRIEMLTGLQGVPLLMYGTWRDRNDVDDLMWLARTREMKVLYITNY
jgi:hypothetical protein